MVGRRRAAGVGDRGKPEDLLAVRIVAMNRRRAAEVEQGWPSPPSLPVTREGHCARARESVAAVVDELLGAAWRTASELAEVEISDGRGESSALRSNTRSDVTA